MNLTLWNRTPVIDEFARARDDMDRMLGRFLGTGLLGTGLPLAEPRLGRLESWSPAIDVSESADEVAARLDRVVERARGQRRTLVFAHGHSLRVLTARWLEQSATEGRFFRLDVSTISVLGFERETPVLLKWNS